MSGLSSAVISEAVSRITSLLTGKYSEHSNVQEWIERLMNARTEIRSAVKESEALKEEFDIDIDEELHEWQEKLKEALCQADEALSNFPAEILHEEPNQTIEGGSSSYDQSMQEGGSDDTTLSHPASNMRETVTHQVNLEANLHHDQSMHEEGTDDATLVHPATNIGVAVVHQVNLEAHLPHDQSMHEETLVHPASNFREAITGQVDLEASMPQDPPMQEEGFDDATFVHPASNLREAVPRKVGQQANLPHDPLMQEEGSDDANLVHTASNLTEAVTHQVDLQANLPHDQPMQEEGSDRATLVHYFLNKLKAIILEVEELFHNQPMQEEGLDCPWIYSDVNKMKANIYQIKLQIIRVQSSLLYNPLMQEEGFDDATLGPTESNLMKNIHKGMNRIWVFLRRGLDSTICGSYRSANPWPSIIHRLSAFSRLLDLRTFSLLDPRMMVVKYLENDEKVSKLLKTVEKLEKMAGNIGNFIKLLDMQKRRKMNRKRKRSGVALQGFFLVLSLKLQTYALFCYREDPYLLVIMLFRENCDIPTGITSDIFIGFVM